MIFAAMVLDDEGLLSGAEYIPSPNCDNRPAGSVIDLVVVHAISLPPNEFGGDAVERLFTNRLDPQQHPYYAEIQALRVSAHFFIRRDGGITQFVPGGKRAWHAGVSSWRGRECCNDFSVGIELEGCDTAPFEPVQYRNLAHLIDAIVLRYGPCEVARHSDIAPGRKTDPGPHFDWQRLHALIEEHRG